jgi:hypothetical protein
LTRAECSWTRTSGSPDVLHHVLSKQSRIEKLGSACDYVVIIRHDHRWRERAAPPLEQQFESPTGALNAG